MNAKKSRESAIPVGTGFSPNLFRLPEFLAAIVKHSGDKEAITDAVWTDTVRITEPGKTRTRRTRSLPVEAAAQYGLMTGKNYDATELARELNALKPPELYERFARHILLGCGGLRVLDGIREMEADEHKVTSDSLARYLTSQGFNVGEHNTGINSLRMWLSLAGVFPTGRSASWRINVDAEEHILGLGAEIIEILSDLTDEQRAFVEGLCVIDPKDWYPASDVRDWAEVTRGVRIGRASLPKEVLNVLEESGIIEVDTGAGTKRGKTSVIRTTSKFSKEVLEPFITITLKDLNPAIRRYYQKRPDDIYKELRSSDPQTKGKALEALTIHVMRLLDLRFIEWRKRATSTAHAEVDAVLSGVLGGIPTRWQVQCKNTPSHDVPLEDVAKEVGLLPITQATHILFVANSRFTPDARKYAAQIMKRSPVTLFLFDKDDFERMRDSPGAIGQILRSKSERIIRRESGGSIFDWD